MEEEKYILTMGQGEALTRFLIERIIRLEDHSYFTLVNLSDGEILFGEYTGTLPAEEDEARETVWRDFLGGCSHICYPDGYIVDDLYEMIDLSFF